MKRILYAYDVLWYECKVVGAFSYAMRVKRYRLKSKNPFVSICITRQPLIDDFSRMPDDYESQCFTIEELVSSSLSLSEMIDKVRQMLRDNFLQMSIDFA